MCPCDDGRMKRRQRFLNAVQILAPGDKFILWAAQGVPEESLPVCPGGAALDLVVAPQKAMASANDSRGGQFRRGPASASSRNQLRLPRLTASAGDRNAPDNSSRRDR